MTITLEDLTRKLAALDSRVAHLEQRQPTRKAGRKKRGGVIPDDVIAERRALWSEYTGLDFESTLGYAPAKQKDRKSHFAIEHGLDPFEFYRWFARPGKKQIAAGESQDIGIRRELNLAIDERRRQRQRASTSHGNVKSPMVVSPSNP